jgi:hypothetical protein
MKTTGVLPEALAASISRFSRSEIAVTKLPFGRVKSMPSAKPSCYLVPA